LRGKRVCVCLPACLPVCLSQVQRVGKGGKGGGGGEGWGDGGSRLKVALTELQNPVPGAPRARRGGRSGCKRRGWDGGGGGGGWGAGTPSSSVKSITAKQGTQTPRALRGWGTGMGRGGTGWDEGTLQWGEGTLQWVLDEDRGRARLRASPIERTRRARWGYINNPVGPTVSLYPRKCCTVRSKHKNR
jgi:hypothetical protein